MICAHCRIFRTDYGHTEVAAHFGNGTFRQHAPVRGLFTDILCVPTDPREYCISTKDFVIDEEGKLKGLNTVRVEWTKDSGGRWKMEEVPGSEKFFPAQLVFLALGFLGPETDIINTLGLKQDARSTSIHHRRATTPVSRVSSPQVTVVVDSL